jgi:hypothetical protein
MESTVEVTSRPLPEVFVAELRMASTASRTEESELELFEVELEVEDSPKSSASDSLVLGFKLFSRELTELEVLIPILLQKAAGCDPVLTITA